MTEVAERLLHQAAGHVISDWQRFAADAIAPAEVAEGMGRLVTILGAGAQGGTAVHGLGTPLDRALLQALRESFVLSLSTRDEAAASFELLQAFERLTTDMTPGWADHLQQRLDGPGGGGLLVEVAHDLRSPLTSILFLAETLLRGRSGPLTTLQVRQVGLIYSAAFGLNSVASDVVELVRGGARLVDGDSKPLSLAGLLDAVRDIVLPLAEEKGIALRFVSPGRDIRLGFAAALNRILLNLTTNGLKFTTTGEVCVTLSEHGDDVVRFEVRDTGAGIPESAMQTLFEPFRRRHQEGDYAFSGSGLGLSICRKLVEAMGSSLIVHTVPGEGTAFTFELAMPPHSGYQHDA